MHLRWLILFFISYACAYKSYKGYKVIRTSALSAEDVENLAPLIDDARFSFWTEPRDGSKALIMTGPGDVEELWRLLQERGLEPTVNVEDVQEVLDQNKAEQTNQFSKLGALNDAKILTSYLTDTEIDSYLDSVVEAYPNITTLEEIGRSYEGRPLRVLRISSPDDTKVKRAGVFIDAGIHAREWLAPAAALYVVHQLTARAEDNAEMLRMADWYIIPLANPDGYNFTWMEDRFWRKTRRPNKGHSDCIGTDPNRNFDFEWKNTNGKGPCLGTYPGPHAFSENESKAIASYLRRKGLDEELDLYMALHAYGKILLYPYGHTEEDPPEKIVTAANAAVEAVARVRGTRYTSGSIAKILYKASGNSQDYAFKVAQIPFAYTWELPPHWEGELNFINFEAPPSEIVPVCSELWEGIKELTRHASADRTRRMRLQDEASNTNITASLAQSDE